MLLQEAPFNVPITNLSTYILYVQTSWLASSAGTLFSSGSSAMHDPGDPLVLLADDLSCANSTGRLLLAAPIGLAGKEILCELCEFKVDFLVSCRWCCTLCTQEDSWIPQLYKAIQSQSSKLAHLCLRTGVLRDAAAFTNSYMKSKIEILRRPITLVWLLLLCSFF